MGIEVKNEGTRGGPIGDVAWLLAGKDEQQNPPPLT